MSQLLIARIDAFTKGGKYVAKGQVISSDEVDYSKDEANSAFIPAPSGVDGSAVIEMSAIAPTGPNPQNPQQIPTGTVQTPEGYVQGGARMVGEVTIEADKRILIVEDDDTQAKVNEALEKADADASEEASKARAKEAKEAKEAKAKA